MPQEPALASEVAFWEERLGGLADAVAPVTPPENAWSRIEAAIAAPATAAPRPSSLWQSLAFWRGFAIGSATLAAASIAALAYIGLVPAARAPLMATLGGTGGQPNFVAAVTATGNSLTVVPASLLTNDPRAIELWLIPAGEPARTRSGSSSPAGRSGSMFPPDLARRLTSDATLAVSLEPPGGSPTGLPTGPVVALGKLTSLVNRVRSRAAPKPLLHPPVPSSRSSIASRWRGATCKQRRSDMKLSRIALPSAVAAAALAFAAVAATPTLAQPKKEQTVTVGGAPMYPSKNIIQNAVNSKDHTTLVAAVKAAGLVETLQGPGPFTVFAPTNAAFAKLPAGTVDNAAQARRRRISWRGADLSRAARPLSDQGLGRPPPRPKARSRSRPWKAKSSPSSSKVSS